MKGKTLGILLILALALGGAWYFLHKRSNDSYSTTGVGGGKVVEFPINDVAQVTIKDTKDTVTLVKKGDTWTVKERQDYPANFEQIATALRKLQDLKTVQEVKVGPSQMPRLELVEPGKGDKTGTLVQLQSADGKSLGGLLLGKKQMRNAGGDDGPMGMGGGGFATGRYVKPLASEKVSLTSETLENLEPKAERWLNKDFVKIEGPKSIAVTGPTPEKKWTVTRDNSTSDWKLADAKPDEKADPGKTGSFGSIFSSASFNDVLAADAKVEEPITNATVETLDGFKYELKIGKEQNDAYPVLIKVSANFPKERTPGKDEKPEDKERLDKEFAEKNKKNEEKLATEKKLEGRAYLVPKYTVDPLLKDRAGLLPDKPAEPAKPAEGAGPAPSATATPPIPMPMPGAPSAASKPVTATTPPLTVPPSTPVPKTATPVPQPATPAPKPVAPAPAAATPAPPAATPAPAPKPAATPAATPVKIPATPAPEKAPATPPVATPPAAPAAAPAAPAPKQP